jgi:hypothetical protein
LINFSIAYLTQFCNYTLEFNIQNKKAGIKIPASNNAKVILRAISFGHGALDTKAPLLEELPDNNLEA